MPRKEGRVLVVAGAIRVRRVSVARHKRAREGQEPNRWGRRSGEGDDRGMNRVKRIRLVSD